MKNKKFLPSLVLLFGLLTICAAGCKMTEFKVEGTVAGAPDKELTIERSDYSGRWQRIGETKTNGSGRFSVEMAAPGAPEVYRLCLDNSFIYFPVEGTETITIDANAASFATDYSIKGSEQAEQMASFEKEAAGLKGMSADSLAAFKRRVYETYIRPGHGNLLSYFVLTKVVDGKALYDPADAQDSKYFAAVATAFREFAPDDPRAQLLEAIAIKGMKARNWQQGRALVVEGSELQMIDIELQDEAGQMRKLSDITGKGKPVVLAFTVMTMPESPEVNRRLASLREAYGADIYQVALDADHYAWRDAAKNLPWVTVIDSRGLQAQSVTDYNVVQLPEFFVINSNGALSARAQNFDELKKALSSIR